MWLTGYATSMCVSADQEHSSPMGAPCLGCRTLQTFHHRQPHGEVITGDVPDRRTGAYLLYGKPNQIPYEWVK